RAGEAPGSADSGRCARVPACWRRRGQAGPAAPDARTRRAQARPGPPSPPRFRSRGPCPIRDPVRASARLLPASRAGRSVRVRRQSARPRSARRTPWTSRRRPGYLRLRGLESSLSPVGDLPGLARNFGSRQAPRLRPAAATIGIRPRTGGQRYPETPALTTIESRLNPRDPQFQDNARTMRMAVADLREQAALAAQGGGVAARERHVARGKMLPRDRVEGLLDPGAPFLELSPLAAHGMYNGDAPGGGVITGIGRISGTECVVVCNDATVKGGTYYPVTVKKHLRAQEIAAENRLPCVYL